MWMSSDLHLVKVREEGHVHNVIDWWAPPGGLCKGPGSPKRRAPGDSLTEAVTHRWGHKG